MQARFQELLVIAIHSHSVKSATLTSKAYGVFHIHGSLHNWQYLFLIEGVITVALAILAFFWMPMSPGSAWFLDEQEKAFAVNRIKVDVARYVQHQYDGDGLEKSSERLSKRDVVEAAKDWKLWYVLFFNICASIPGQAFSVFLPLVVKGLGYTSIQANLVG